jgi:hypothetical protein
MALESLENVGQLQSVNGHFGAGAEKNRRLWNELWGWHEVEVSWKQVDDDIARSGGFATPVRGGQIFQNGEVDASRAHHHFMSRLECVRSELSTLSVSMVFSLVRPVVSMVECSVYLHNSVRTLFLKTRGSSTN